MDDFPWVYAAMIFIAFLSWLHSRIQQAAARRRERAAAKKAATQSRRIPREATPPSPFHRPVTTTPPSRPLPAPAPLANAPGEIAVPRTFREFFEMLATGEVPEAVAPSPPAAIPPPPLPPTSPHSAPEPARRATSPQPATAAALVSGAGAEVTTRFSRRLRSRGSLREALILKEILDAPVSLRE